MAARSQCEARVVEQRERSDDVGDVDVVVGGSLQRTVVVIIGT